jgi:hypothetical protein
MYYGFKPAVIEWNNHELHAQLVGDLQYSPGWLEDQPLQNFPTKYTFKVYDKAPLLDNYFTGASFSLYSLRLINLLEKVEIRFETFPATLIGRKNDQVVSTDYAVFHLMEVYPAVKQLYFIGDNGQPSLEEADYKDVELALSPSDKQFLQKRKIVQKLELIGKAVEAKRPLFRLQEVETLILIHENLKTVLEEEQITGCAYIPLERFQAFPS